MKMLFAVGISTVCSLTFAQAAEPSWMAINETGFSMIIPGAWRRISMREGDPLRLYLSGDGVGAAPMDDTGEPLQLGIVVERATATKETAEELAKKSLQGVRDDPKAALLSEGTIQPIQLCDGSKAALLTTEFLRKDKDRKSVYLKVIAVDRQSVEWSATAWMVLGKKAIPNHRLLNKMRSHIMSFCFDPKRLTDQNVKAAYAAAPR